jgi:ferredoxin
VSEKKDDKKADGKGVSRRDLLTFWRREPAKKGPPAPPPPPPPPARDPLRPPGAIDEMLFADRCQRCGKCVEVCPRQAIFPLDASFGRAAGTPAIIPLQAPCVVCNDLSCMASCPSGALQKLALFDVQMGTAVIEPGRCVTWAGQACAKCVQACCVPGAIQQDDAGHPVVREGVCIGCGACEFACPTDQPSIFVIPARDIIR